MVGHVAGNQCLVVAFMEVAIAIGMFLACVAIVSVGFCAFFRCLNARKSQRERKKRRRGGAGGEKTHKNRTETLATQAGTFPKGNWS